MKKSLIISGILMGAVLLSGCNFKAGNNDAIIKVNGENITKAQFDEAFDKSANKSALAQLGIDLRKDPDNYVHLLLKDRVINELIMKKLQDQEVQKRKIKVTNEDFEKAYNEVLEQVGGKEKFEEILKQNGISHSAFKNDFKEELKLKKLVDTLGIVNITDKQVETYYKKNIKEFNYPERVKSAHILISADPVQAKDVLLAKAENKKLSKEELDKKVQEELASKKTKAEEILKQLKQDPTQFAKLAKENSDDIYTAENGGDLGYLSREQLPEFYAKIAFSQKPNTISDLVVTPAGYHIIMVTDRQKAGVEPFEKVKAQLKNYLEMQEKVKLYQKFLEEVKNKAEIEYIDKSYSPEEIEKKLEEAKKKNPSLEGAQSAAE